MISMHFKLRSSSVTTGLTQQLVKLYQLGYQVRGISDQPSPMEVCEDIKLRTGMNSIQPWPIWVSLDNLVVYVLCIRVKLDLYLSIDMVNLARGDLVSVGTWT